MKNILQQPLIIFSFMIIPFVCYGESEVEDLSSELRSLLNKEMIALQDGMTSLLPAYISGDLEEVAHIAHNMKNSYILKQEITSDQKHELMNKLPESFLHLDQKFHDYAGMLEHVSKEQHLELVGFYYYKLTESCIECHSQFANHKFPNLSSGSKEHGH